MSYGQKPPIEASLRSWRSCACRSGKCEPAGAREAGQGRGAASGSERSLDATKRSRKISCRSDDGMSGKLRRLPERVPGLSARGSCGKDPQKLSLAQHVSDSDMWGVSDPAGRPWGRVCRAWAGSLTPHPCCYIRAGALTGRHNAPPDLTAPSATTSQASSSSRHAMAVPVIGPLPARATKCCGSRGQPRLDVASPSSAPRRSVT